MKRVLLVLPITAFALLLSAVTASAAEFCSDDPAINFVDTKGHLRTVYLTTYGEGLEHSQAVKAQVYSYSVEYADHGHKTKVRLKVFVPDDSPHHFHVRSVVSTAAGGAGTTLAHHDGDSGHRSYLEFEVAS